MKKIFYYLLAIGLIYSLSGCKKYLDAKPNSRLTTLQTLENLQSILDDELRLNYQWANIGEISTNDYYLTDVDLTALVKDSDRKMYNWETDNLQATTFDGWYYSYLPVYYGNSVLEALPNIVRNGTNSNDYDNIKGQAYFFKGAAMLAASVVFCQAYDENAGSKQLGLPIRTGTDFNVPSVRSNLADTYLQLISDLKRAATLLKVKQVHVMRPSKIAAYAMLSRAYLSINKYAEATLYADSALQLNSQLLDYNTLNANAEYPIAIFNVEVLVNLMMITPDPLKPNVAKIPNELYSQYKTGDLRKTVFFKSNGNNTWAFKGSYNGDLNFFCGPAVDEMYLNRAEGYARAGKLTEALADLNQLLRKRWNKAITYIPYQSNEQETVINWILEERRKELLMRGLRWMDIKRLNRMGANITLARNMNSSNRILKPNDLRYALPIPEEIINLTGMEQNPK
ncbi:RagB/SusD family nutrient uptake outer membrane protein [Pedobacter sp. UBA5917]|uniref:RagB/SusD family nutrient uptake outer membrane protein n=1 Tax=Pedobacter sp. UBA5917 TaxID=1947061 RepID=UPI0025F13BF1|nr:RagB/SusD family nutrient uptake outer membrane protein [Pedobacter sp. UBA5917]